MYFPEALKEMKKGKSVRRPKWKEETYWSLGKGGVILCNGYSEAKVYENQIMADDWIVCTDKPLSDKIRNEDNHISGEKILTVKDVKQSIKSYLDYFATRGDFHPAQWGIMSKKAKEIFGEKLT